MFDFAIKVLSRYTFIGPGKNGKSLVFTAVILMYAFGSNFGTE